MYFVVSLTSIPVPVYVCKTNVLNILVQILMLFNHVNVLSTFTNINYLIHNMENGFYIKGCYIREMS